VSRAVEELNRRLLRARDAIARAYDHLIQGKVWRRDDVEAWVRRYRPNIDDETP
jgi:hypothetical protein